jgi:S-formylglutathione hydrolase
MWLMPSSLQTVATHQSFGGVQSVYAHQSTTLGVEMRFSVYLPADSESRPCPVLIWLSGLTCTEQNFTTKAGFQRYAAQHRIAVVALDTSPRGADVADAPQDALGQGAGFYVNATQAPWQAHFQMYDYVAREMPQLICDQLPIRDCIGISGHSMGGHGALVLGLREPQRFASVSAFAPICAPTQVPWGQQAFRAYFGDEAASIAPSYDAVELLATHRRADSILVDQGLGDPFLATQLRPDLLAAAAKRCGQSIELRQHPGYDHSYYFVASFIGEHIAFHARRLGAEI